VNTKVADGALVEHFSFAARSGLSCGADFLAGEFLQAHPEFNWTQPLLRDMRGNPWAEFKVADKLK
jgi:hypothetical protein